MRSTSAESRELPHDNRYRRWELEAKPYQVAELHSQSLLPQVVRKGEIKCGLGVHFHVRNSARERKVLYFASSRRCEQSKDIVEGRGVVRLVLACGL